MSWIRKWTFYPQSLWLRLRLAAARSLLRSPYRWQALDRLGIPGFGTDLLRVDFAPRVDESDRRECGGLGRQKLVDLIDAGLPAIRERLARIMAHTADCQRWPAAADPARPGEPNWQNEFLTPVDMLTLYGTIRELRPGRYIEIGSGMSTRVVHAAKRDGGLATEIVSIDPCPRVEVEALCDRAIRGRLEDSVATVLSLVRPGDVVFFDGSHRAFPGSDVTLFFLEILPALPPGCEIHIHDIYLPDDYPARAWNRLWSEQYMLAAWLLGGAKGTAITLPCACLCRDPAATALLRQSPLVTRDTAPAASSFWMRRTS
jgi:hypothetical protein